MLPGLVFGNLSENTGALTSNSRINENIRAANEAIVEVLQECHDEVLADVNAAASRVPESDAVSITDPYAYYISCLLYTSTRPSSSAYKILEISHFYTLLTLIDRWNN